MSPTRDLWCAAGRAARDDRKRLLALQGLLWSGPLLVLGSLLARLPDPDMAGILRPLQYVLDPLLEAWRHDRDLALFGYLGLQLLLLALLWGLFGGAIYRLAAVDLTQRRRDDGRAALVFSRRHWRAFVGSRVALWLGVVVPLGAAIALATTGRLPGWFGGLLLAVAVGAAIILALVAVAVASVCVTAGFLSGPAVACEDSDAFEGVSRTFTYAAAGLPRLVGWRLLFAGGVLLGTVWCLVRLVAVVALAWTALRLGAGAAALDRALAILGATGTPADAERLGITTPDYVVAFVFALGAGSLVILWLADLVSRLCCARTAVYLLLRRVIDHVPVDRLRTAPHTSGHRSAEEAGFVEVERIDSE